MKFSFFRCFTAACLFGGTASMAGSQTAGSFETVQVALPSEAGAVLTNIADVFARQLQRRCSTRVVRDGSAPFTLELVVEPGIGKEGFRITDGQRGGVRIAGSDERGVLYGVGKFLRTSRYERGFAPGVLAIARPRCDGMTANFANFLLTRNRLHLSMRARMRKI